VKQHHRIHAAGNGDEDFLTGRKQAVVHDLIFAVLKEFTHAAILLFLGALGKPPAQ